jgi:hypothetical protein
MQMQTPYECKTIDSADMSKERNAATKTRQTQKRKRSDTYPEKTESERQ